MLSYLEFQNQKFHAMLLLLNRNIKPFQWNKNLTQKPKRDARYSSVYKGAQAVSESKTDVIYNATWNVPRGGWR